MEFLARYWWAVLLGVVVVATLVRRFMTSRNLRL